MRLLIDTDVDTGTVVNAVAFSPSAIRESYNVTNTTPVGRTARGEM